MPFYKPRVRDDAQQQYALTAASSETWKKLHSGHGLTGDVKGDQTNVSISSFQSSFKKSFPLTVPPSIITSTSSERDDKAESLTFLAVDEVHV